MFFLLLCENEYLWANSIIANSLNSRLHWYFILEGIFCVGNINQIYQQEKKRTKSLTWCFLWQYALLVELSADFILMVTTNIFLIREYGWDILTTLYTISVFIIVHRVEFLTIFKWFSIKNIPWNKILISSCLKNIEANRNFTWKMTQSKICGELFHDFIDFVPV